MKKGVATGQSMTEYGLIGALVLIVCIAALVLLSGSVKSLFEKFTAGLGSPSGTAAITTAGGASDSGNPQFSTGSANSPFFNPKAPTGSQLPASLQSAIQTSGGNGTIEFLSGQLRQTVSDLLAKGEITEQEAGYLNDLANRGHRIAQISGLIEEHAKTCVVDRACFSEQRLEFDGTAYTVEQLQGMIGFTNESDGATVKNPEVAALWEEYKTAYNTVLKDKPELATQIETLTGQIADTSSVVNESTAAVLSGNVSPDSMQDNIIQRAQGKDLGITVGMTAEEAVHQDSSTICTSGEGVSDGTSCR